MNKSIISQFKTFEICFIIRLWINKSFNILENLVALKNKTPKLKIQ